MSDIFDQAKGTVPDAQQEVQPTTTPEVAVEYNGKVWKQEDILNKFQNADEYITQLRAENERLAQEATKGATLDEVLTRMETKPEPPKPVEPTKTPVAEVDVEAVAMTAYEKIKQREQAELNLAENIGALQQKFGDKAVDVLKDKAAEVGMTLDEARELAATRPLLFKQSFLGGSQQVGVPSTSGNINTQTLQQTNNKPAKLSSLKGKDFQEEFAKRAANLKAQGYH